jgi:4-hydroxy-2-oxoheptanedioate aldolase
VLLPLSAKPRQVGVFIFCRSNHASAKAANGDIRLEYFPRPEGAVRHNITKEKLKNGQTVFGCFVRYANAALVEVLSYCDWDFICFDGEHGSIEPADCEQMTRAAELRGVTPIVRVPVNLPHVILRFMDTGVHGLHVPMINSGVDAEAVVQSVKYQPRGCRGLAGVRAGDYAQAVPFVEYVAIANAETLVTVQIETVAAVDRLPEIIAVDGLDVIFIGPTDLSNSLGLPGQLQHPKVQAILQRIVDMVVPTGLALGIMVPNAEAARQWRDRGARYIAVGLESLMNPSCRNYLKTARDTP